MSEALARLPLPVAVVAAAYEGARSCNTGTLTYVAYSPPLVATPLAKTSRTLALARESGRFSLSVLADDQAEVAVRAARPGVVDKFAEQEIPLLEDDGVPAVAGAAVVLWCAFESALETDAHVLFIGRVERFRSSDRLPLVRFERSYRALGPSLDVVTEARYPL